MAAYDEIRPQIADGDLIAFKAYNGWFAAAIKLVTRTSYTHTAVALWLEGGLWIAEMNAGGGNVLVPLSQRAHQDFEVFACPVPAGKVREAVLATLRDKIRYDFADLFRIAAHKLFGIALPEREDPKLVCSAYSGKIYFISGWAPKEFPSIAAPSDVVAALGGSPKLTYVPA